MSTSDPTATDRTSALLIALMTASKEGVEGNLRRFYHFAGVTPGEYVELQVLHVRRGNWTSNKFAHASSIENAIRLATEADAWTAPATYILFNKINGAVATRATPDKWHDAQKGESTTDNEIIARRLLFVDIDARRPKQTSSSDKELHAAMTVTVTVYEHLTTLLGTKESLAIGMSGNGGAVFIALADLPPSDQVSAVVRGILCALSVRYSSEQVVIDESVSDLKRLTSCFGSRKKKGVSGHRERPHRRTALLVPEHVKRVDLPGLEKLLHDLTADLSDEQRTEVDRAMGRKASGAKASSQGTRTSGANAQAGAEGVRCQRTPDRADETEVHTETIFQRANRCDIRQILERFGLLDGDEVTCPGCGTVGTRSDTSVKILGNGLKCSHARCTHKGRNGYRTPIDVVMERTGGTPMSAVRILADQFGFDVAPHDHASTAPPGGDSDDDVDRSREGDASAGDRGGPSGARTSAHGEKDADQEHGADNIGGGNGDGGNGGGGNGGGGPGSGPREADDHGPDSTRDAQSRWKTPAERALGLGNYGPRLLTGFKSFDLATRGGLPARRRVFVGGPPGVGKTTFLMQLVHSFLLLGAYVGVLAADEDADSLLVRLGQLYGIDRDLLDLEPSEANREHATAAKQELAKTVGALGERLLLVDADETTGTWPISLELVSLELSARRPEGAVSVLLIDSIQTVTANGTENARDPRMRTEAVLTALRLAAKGDGHLVLATSEVHRGAYRDASSRTNDLASFKESGGIEFKSDIALVLHSTTPGGDLVDVSLVKNRLRGPTSPTSFQMMLDRKTARFSEVEPFSDEEEMLQQAKKQDQKYQAARARVIEAVAKTIAPIRNATELLERAMAGRVKASRQFWLRVIRDLREEGVIKIVDGRFQVVSSGSGTGSGTDAREPVPGSGSPIGEPEP